MKKLLFLLILLPFFGLSQTTGFFRYDTVRFQKAGASSEFILENATKGNTNAFLQNYSQGRTRFAYALDSVWLDGDSIRFRYGSTTVAVHIGGSTSIDTTSLSNRINLKVNISDTSAMLAPYLYGFNNIGSTPNAQGASVGSHLITLQPADSSFGGVWSTANEQKIRGRKHFLNPLQISRYIPGVGYEGMIFETGAATGTRPDGLHIGWSGTGSFIRSRKGDLSAYLGLNIDAKTLILSAVDSIRFLKAGTGDNFQGSALHPDTLIGMASNGTLDKVPIGSGLSLAGGVLSTTSSSTPNTIYSANDTLVDSRQVDMKGYSLEFLNSGLFRIQDTAGTVEGTYDFNEGIDFVVSDASNNVAIKADPTVGVSLKSGTVATNESRIELGPTGVSLSMRDSVGGTINEIITGDIYTYFNNPFGVYSFMAVPDSTVGNTFMAVLRESDSDPGNYELTKAPIPTGGGGSTDTTSLSNRIDAKISTTTTNPAHTGTTPSGTGVIGATMFARLTSNHSLADNTTDQPAFSSGFDVWTLQGNTTYEVEGLYHINMGTTTHLTQMGFTLGGGASVTSILYDATSWTNAPGTGQTAQYTILSNVATATTVSLFDGAATKTVRFKGMISMNAGGTVTPFVKFSVAPGGTNEVVAGSYIKFTPIGTGTVTSQGAVN